MTGRPAGRLAGILGLPFLPAIAVMNRLTFARKFIVVGLLLSGPSAVILYLQTSIATQRLDFNSRERTGVAYLSTAQALLQALERHQILAAAVGAGSLGLGAASEEAADEVRRAVAAMDAADGLYGAALETTGEWRALRASLLQRGPSAELSDQLVSLVLHRAGNNSNLTLDPDLDSYWLMNGYLLRLPALAEAVTRGTTVHLGSGPAGSERLIELAAAYRLELSTVEALERVDLETAFRETARFGRRGQLRSSLAPPLDRVRVAVQRHAALLREAIEQAGPWATPEHQSALTAAALDALARTLEMHQQIGPELDALVEARVARHRAERLNGLVAGAALLAVLSYLFVAIYLSIRSSVNAIRSYARTSGAGEAPMAAPSRDELGQIAVAYSKAQGEMSRLEEQLRQADRLSTLGMLAAGTAHELNEPLGAILGFAQLARKTPSLPEPAARDLGKIEKAALHAREVIRQLMLFARQTPPRKAPVGLKGVVEEALEFLRPRSEQDGVTLRSDLEDGLPDLVADASQLRQTVLNLVVNALQATARGGEVRIGLRRDLTRLCLSVDDQGTGMTEEVRSRLFLPFFTTKDVGKGTGLGLSVVHGIVSAHGGTIEVESASGRGTRFTVLLPLSR